MYIVYYFKLWLQVLESESAKISHFHPGWWHRGNCTWHLGNCTWHLVHLRYLHLRYLGDTWGTCTWGTWVTPGYLHLRYLSDTWVPAPQVPGCPGVQVSAPRWHPGVQVSTPGHLPYMVRYLGTRVPEVPVNPSMISIAIPIENKGV